MARGSAPRPRAISALPLRCLRCRRRAAKNRRSATPLWWVHGGKGAAFVDLQNDVTTKDIELARLEGYGASEHVKRYTTLGMGTDQGKTANVVALGVLSELTGAPIPAIGTTGFRPPYTPVTWGALAGHHRGKDFRPKRLPPSHVWAEENGAVFADAGLWLRAQWYERPGETLQQSIAREAAAVRQVGRGLRRVDARQDRHSGA